MYDSGDIAKRIKATAKEKGVSVKQVLEEAELGFNTMSNMKTSMPKADNLAKIADSLGVSVDLLLGREVDLTPANEYERPRVTKGKRLHGARKIKNAPDDVEDVPKLSIDEWKEILNQMSVEDIADFLAATAQALQEKKQDPAE